METVDENRMETMTNKATDEQRPQASTSRTILGSLPVTNNVVEKPKAKANACLKGSSRSQTINLQSGWHKSQPGLTGTRQSKVSTDCRPSTFQIFCDSSDSENNLSNHEVEIGIDLDDIKEEMESCEQTDHLLSERTENSLAIEEEEEEVIQEFDESDIRCEETIDFESDEELEDATDHTSEVHRSFDLSALSKCKEYADEIHKYLLSYERKYMADPFYIAKQPEINAKMRSILIDWLVEVTEEYKLLDQTLFLAVNYIDRFLSLMSVSRQSFQLLGTSALFIASKYEEIYPPELTEFVYITDDSYTKGQILNMEKLVLKGLRFDVSAPTTYYFIEKYCSVLELSPITKHLSKYLCHLTLLESEPFLRYFPSEIAICSIILSVNTLGLQSEVSNDFLEHSIAFEKELKSGDVEVFISERQSCLEALHRMHAFAHKHPQQAIQTKYMSEKYYRVANIEPLPTSPRIY